LYIHFGIDFDGPVHAPVAQEWRQGELYVGPHKLLQWGEAQWGLSGSPANTEYLRIELYRQALTRHVQESVGQPFYARSLEADRFATATALLDMRDELLLCGWDFHLTETLPPRLRDFAAVEVFYQIKIADPALTAQTLGFAERFEALLAQIAKSDGLPPLHFQVYEPVEWYPPALRRFFHLMEQKGVSVSPRIFAPAAPPDTPLGRFQRYLMGEEHLQPLPPCAGEGNILIAKARHDASAARHLAQLLRENPTFHPLFLLPDLNLLPDQHFTAEGMPPMGLESASLARPSLQVLKLATVFLWEPVDVQKIMEFVTLPLKPLDTGLAIEIARVLAQKPGLFNDTWFAAIYGYLERPETTNAARRQYEFWFDRRRYRSETQVPVREVIEIYTFLEEWAREAHDENHPRYTALSVLAQQAQRIGELLEALPETRIGFLDLERIVRTVYEPAPLQPVAAQTGSFPYIHAAGALTTPVQTLVWWNYRFQQNAPPPDKWQAPERQYIASVCGTGLQKNADQSRLQLLLHHRPVLLTTDTWVLVMPEYVEGTAVSPGPLGGDLEAFFKKEYLGEMTVTLDSLEGDPALRKKWVLPKAERLAPVQTRRAPAHLYLRHPEYLPAPEYETPTNLEALFYYPHRWLFKKLRLVPTGLLSIDSDNRLLGNLAHRFFEMLLQEDLQSMERDYIRQWIDSKSKQLLEREGATLLLYGREPECNIFLKRITNAAWTFVELVRNNGWTVAGTEMDLDGLFENLPVQGKADIVLQRGDELAIIDLKWSGATRRRDMIRNGEDLQLVLYAHLLPPDGYWPFTAYFILEEGQLIARTADAFREARLAIGPQAPPYTDACSAILERMGKTWQWRMQQVQKGTIELRTARTADVLDAFYEGELGDLLEMKRADAKWDEYAILLNAF
jgi:hypothetical protein